MCNTNVGVSSGARMLYLKRGSQDTVPLLSQASQAKAGIAGLEESLRKAEERALNALKDKTAGQEEAQAHLKQVSARVSFVYLACVHMCYVCVPCGCHQSLLCQASAY